MNTLSPFVCVKVCHRGSTRCLCCRCTRTIELFIEVLNGDRTQPNTDSSYRAFTIPISSVVWFVQNRTCRSYRTEGCENGKPDYLIQFLHRDRSPRPSISSRTKALFLSIIHITHMPSRIFYLQADDAHNRRLYTHKRRVFCVDVLSHILERVQEHPTSLPHPS